MDISLASIDSPSLSNVIFPTLIISFCSLYAILAWRWRFQAKDEGLPGPEKLPRPKSFDPTGIIGNVMEIHPIHEIAPKILKLSENYGDIFNMVFLRRNIVILNSAPLIQTLMQSSDAGHLTKPFFYKLMEPIVTEKGLLITNDMTRWQQRRKIIMKSQSYTNLIGYVPLIHKNCLRMVSNLDQLFKDGKTHTINELINLSFIQVINEIITGYDHDRSEEIIQFHSNFQVWKSKNALRAFHPWNLLEPIWRLNPMSRKADKAHEEMLKFPRDRVREHKEKRAKIEKGEEKTRTDTFRTILDELDDAGLSESDMIHEINTLLFAGHETTAGAMHYFFFTIALNPDIQKECQKEIDELFESIKCNGNGMITLDMATGGLKLVERCILETMRQFPPVFAFLRELKTPLKLSHDEQDYLLPTGTIILVSPYMQQMNPNVFPDPHKYNPDRFLPEEITKRHPYTYLPFSAGPRNCLGLKLAMMKMKIFAAHILHNFSITTTDRVEDIALLPHTTMTPSKDFEFQFTRRVV